MKRIRENTHWIVALVGAVCLVVAAVGMAQRRNASPVPTARSTRELSRVFRQVSQEALPSVVTIVTETKARQGRLRTPFDEDSPFNDLFRNHPEFREFFEDRQFRIPPVHGVGSGFIIDAKGTIMTNSHVVRNAEKVIVRLHDGSEYEAKDIRTDPRSDVAVLHIDAPRGLKAVRFGNSDAMEIGDWVLAIGNPFGLDLSVTAGIISAKGRGPGIEEREDFLQTDAAINPGNSGGPLLNLNGEVIGINTAISSRSGGYDGISFAIPINMARWVGDQLIDEGAVKRAYIGVGIREVSNDIAKRFGTRVGQGAVVYLVTPDSPAAKAGLEPGDVILQFAGQDVQGPRSLQGIVERLKIGKSYPVKIIRDGKQKQLSIAVGEMPEDLTSASLEQPGRRGPGAQSTFDELGLEVESIPSEVAGNLGISPKDGVLVSAVKAGSPAQFAGLQAGDVIEKVGSQRVRSVTEFRNAVKDASLEEGILLIVRNENGTRFVVIQAQD